ncbi:MAG: GAF domain-containing sensor histidine kinase [Gemmatimonadetes bacterium]|nr:GAF domain-containing sensor histidine kinase [Gemmatimonadota bacterium]
MPRRSPTPPSPTGPGEVQRVRQRFEQLLAVGVGIVSEHSLGAVLQRVVDAAREVVGARYAALGVMNDEGTGLAQFVTSGLSPEQRDRIGAPPRGHGLLGAVIREARPIRTADLAHHPQHYGFPPHHPPMKSFLGVPVAGRERVYGNLYLTDKIGAAEFNDEDQDIAVLLATQAAVAMENARLLGQVQEMQRQRDLFFAMMNHELRNALTGVYGWAERLVRRRGGEGSTRAAQEVYEAAERTITLLNNFLDLTRLDAGKMRPVWRDVEISTAVERALVGLQPVAEVKGIAIDVSISDASPPLRSDPVRIEQILVNLLSNAVRHSPEGGAIRVRVETTAAEVRISVSDEGPGVPVELQTKIFEPFERYDPHSGVGTGLGLHVSRRLAEVMGGRLMVASSDAKGATFLLTLPLAPPES